MIPVPFEIDFILLKLIFVFKTIIPEKSAFVKRRKEKNQKIN